jgi:N-methylhydantoinase B/oxoprolinase/acetone carboxylase alpha subunit
LLNGQPIDPGDGILVPGDILTLETPGGGGLHLADQRPVEQVLRDVENGLLSPVQARDIYGVCEQALLSLNVRSTLQETHEPL